MEIVTAKAVMVDALVERLRRMREDALARSRNHRDRMATSDAGDKMYNLGFAHGAEAVQEMLYDLLRELED